MATTNDRSITTTPYKRYRTTIYPLEWPMSAIMSRAKAVCWNKLWETRLSSEPVSTIKTTGQPANVPSNRPVVIAKSGLVCNLTVEEYLTSISSMFSFSSSYERKIFEYASVEFWDILRSWEGVDITGLAVYLRWVFVRPVNLFCNSGEIPKISFSRRVIMVSRIFCWTTSLSTMSWIAEVKWYPPDGFIKVFSPLARSVPSFGVCSGNLSFFAAFCCSQPSCVLIIGGWGIGGDFFVCVGGCRVAKGDGLYLVSELASF